MIKVNKKNYIDLQRTLLGEREPYLRRKKGDPIVTELNRQFREEHLELIAYNFMHGLIVPQIKFISPSSHQSGRIKGYTTLYAGDGVEGNLKLTIDLLYDCKDFRFDQDFRVSLLDCLDLSEVLCYLRSEHDMECDYGAGWHSGDESELGFHATSENIKTLGNLSYIIMSLRKSEYGEFLFQV